MVFLSPLFFESIEGTCTIVYNLFDAGNGGIRFHTFSVGRAAVGILLPERDSTCLCLTFARVLLLHQARRTCFEEAEAQNGTG